MGEELVYVVFREEKIVEERMCEKMILICFCSIFSSPSLPPVRPQVAQDESRLVRKNVLMNLKDVVAHFQKGKDTQGEVFKILLDFCLRQLRDHDWRVRLTATEQLHHLVPVIGKDRVEELVVPQIVSLCCDPAAGVRDQACIACGPLASTFGSEWATEKLLPPILKSYDEQTSYLRRHAAFVVIANVAPTLSAESIEAVVLPYVTRVVRDEVANVQVMACKAMSEIIARLGPSHSIVERGLMPALEALSKSPDHDVKFFAERAMNSPGEFAASSRNKFAPTCTSNTDENF